METKPIQLPRVLVNVRRGYAMEILRGYKFAHVVNADNATINYERVSLEKLGREWKEFSTDPAQVLHFCVVCLNSFRAKTVRAERTLREIKSMSIDVQKATTDELVAFYNSKQADEKKKVKKFADRKTAEERVTKLLASLAPAATGATDADAPIPEDKVAPTVSPTTTKKEKATMTTKTTKAKSGKPNKSTKSASAKPKKAATTTKKSTGKGIAAGVKESWTNKKVAAARSLKHKVKVGGVLYRSCAEAFQKLKLNFSKCVQFRRELKLSPNGRATFEGKVFTLVEPE